MNMGENFDNRKKVALFLMGLGESACQKVLDCLDENTAREILNQMSELSPEELKNTEIVNAEIEHKIKKLVDNLSADEWLMEGVDNETVITLLKDETPQTGAILLALLRPRKATEILSSLPHIIRAGISKKIACLDATSPDFIKKVKRIMDRMLSEKTCYGIETMLEIISSLTDNDENEIFKSLEEEDRNILKRLESGTASFDDIQYMDDEKVKILVSNIDLNILCRALKTSSVEIQNKFFKNISEEQGQSLEKLLEENAVSFSQSIDAQKYIASLL